MTLATVAAPSGNGLAVLVLLFALIVVITIGCFWQHGQMWDAHERELAANAEQIARLDYRLDSLLEFLGVEVPDPVEDDSPAAFDAALEEVTEPDDTQTDDSPAALQQSSNAADDDTPTLPNIPAIPATEPSGIPIQVHGALIEARDLSGEFPHPVDSAERKAKSAAEIEEALKQFTFTGRNR